MNKSKHTHVQDSPLLLMSDFGAKNCVLYTRRFGRHCRAELVNPSFSWPGVVIDVPYHESLRSLCYSYSPWFRVLRLTVHMQQQELQNECRFCRLFLLISSSLNPTLPRDTRKTCCEMKAPTHNKQLPFHVIHLASYTTEQPLFLFALLVRAFALKSLVSIQQPVRHSDNLNCSTHPHQIFV